MMAGMLSDVAPSTRSDGALSVDGIDGMRWLTVFAISGALVAGVLALIGGFPFDVPMPTHAFGWVEPSCGLTRGTTAIARGDFALAWRYNPMSFALAVLGIIGAVRAAVGLTTNRWVNVRIHLGRWWWLVLAVALIALTIYQQGNAEFIIHSRA